MILTIRLNDQASRHMRRFGQEVKGLAKLQQAAARVGIAEEKQARNAEMLAKRARAIENLSGVEASKLIDRRNALARASNKIAEDRQGIYDRQSKILGQIQTKEDALNKVASDRLRTQSEIARQQERVAAQRVRVAQAEPVAQAKARADILRKAQAQTEKAIANTVSSMRATEKLEKSALTIAEDRVALEKQLRSERGKLGAATKAVRAAERAKLDPATTGATAAQQAARAAYAQTAGELQNLTRAHTALGIQAELYGKRVGDAAREVTKLKQQLQAVPATAGVGEREALTRTLADQEAKLKSLQTTMAGYDTAVAGHNRRIRELRTDQDAATRAMNDLPSRINDNKDAFRTLDEQMARHRRALEDATDDHARAQRAFARSTQELNALKQELSGVRWDAMQRGSAAASHLGRSMALAGGVGVGALALLGNEAAKLNTSATLAATQMSDTAQASVANGKAIEEAVLGVMQRSTSSAMDLSDAMYNIFSSTNIQSIGEGTRFLKLMSDGAVAGLTNVKDVTDLSITVMNNFGIATKDMRKTMEQMFSAVRFGRITFEEYSQSLSQVVPAAQAANQSFEDMNAAFAFTTRNLGVSFARTGLARLYELLERPAAVEGLRQLGVAVLDADGKMRPFHDIIADIARQVPALTDGTKSAQAFFREITKAGGAPVGQAGTIQSARVFEVAVEHASELLNVQKEINTTNNQFNQQLKAMEQTTGVQWDEFKVKMQALALTIGTVAIPVLMKLGTVLASAAEWFNNLSPGVRETIVQITAYAAIASLVLGVVLALVGGLAALIISFKTVGSTVKTLLGFLGTGGVAGGLDDVGKSSGGAAGGLGKLADEAGSASTKFAKMFGTIGLVIAAIPLMNQLFGGLGNTIKFLSAVLMAFTVRTAIVRLLALGGAAGGVRLALMALTMNPWVITVTVVFLAARQIAKHIEDIQKMVDEAETRTYAPKGPLMTTFAGKIATEFQEAKDKGEGVAATLEKWRTKLGGSLQAADILARAFGIMRERQEALRLSAAALTAEYAKQERFIGKPGHSAADLKVAVPELVGGKYTDAAFQKHFKALEKMRQAAEKAPTFAGWMRYFNALKDFQNKSTQEQQKAMELMPQMTDAAVVKAVQRIEQMRLAAEKAPSMKNWLAYYRAQEALQNKATAEQIKAAEEMAKQAGPTMASAAVLAAVQNIERLKAVAEAAPTMAHWEAYYAAQEALSKQATNAQIQSAQAAVDAMKDMKPSMSNADLAGLIRQAENMRRQLEKSPSAQGWIDYYALLDRISKVSTDSQRQAIESYVSAQNDLVEKAKGKLKELNDALVGMYQEIRQENQNLFGSLLAGPEMSRLNDEVDKIKKVAKSKTDALRDQIDDLQDAADNIDSATGNMIDWGIIPKVDNKAAIKSLEDRIKGIDEAADAAAEKLRTRIEEKRFTPKEIQADLQKQMNQFLQFSRTLDALRKRGAPIELVEQLKALGPEALPAIKAIQKMNPKQWEQYVGTFKKAQKLIDDQSKKDLQSELKKYQDRGKLIAQAIISGVTSQDAALQASIQRLILKLFPELSGRLQASTTTRRTQSTTPAPAKAKTPAATTATNVSFNYHYHNEGGKGMGADTWFRRQSFRDRTRTRTG